MRNGCLITFKKVQKQPLEVLYKKAVLKNFRIFTGRTEKHLCWSLALIQNIVKFLRASILKNICERLLLKMCSWNWEKLKIIHMEFKFFLHQYHKKVKMFVFISWLVSHEVCIHIQCFFVVVRNKLQALNIY